MASAADPHSILYKGNPEAPFQPKRANQPRIQRYFAGVVPSYVFKPRKKDADDAPSLDAQQAAGDESNEESFREEEPPKRIRVDLANSSCLKHRLGPVAERSGGIDGLDYDLNEFQSSVVTAGGVFGDESGCPEIIRLGEPLRKGDHTDHSEVARIRESTDDSDDAQSDSDESAAESITDQPRVTYVPAHQRLQVREREAELKCQAAAKKEARERQKQEASRQLLVESLERDEMAAAKVQLLARANVKAPPGMPDDTDDLDELTEYEQWRERELERLRRNELEAIAREKYEQNLERRRLMTEEERLADDARLDANKPEAIQKSKYTFLQKYYHKGAFFQDTEEEIYRRDFNAPTAEDQIDKATLPKPMQVRRGQFGQKGRTKHTYLTAEDTTDFTSAWSKTFRAEHRERK